MYSSLQMVMFKYLFVFVSNSITPLDLNDDQVNEDIWYVWLNDANERFSQMIHQIEIKQQFYDTINQILHDLKKN